MKKYLFFDVDGTLYNHDKIIPKSTLEALEIAKNNGHEIAIATGRAPFMIKDILKELNIHTYVSLNGQYVVYNNEVIFTDGISNETLTEIIEFGSARNEPRTAQAVYRTQRGILRSRRKRQSDHRR